MKVYRKSFYPAKQKDSGTEEGDLKRGMIVCGLRKWIACNIEWRKRRTGIIHEEVLLIFTN
jgi:hypothetical protein